MASPGSELVISIQSRLGVTFDKPSLIHEAFMAAGAVNRDGNKDLALIGDSALQLFLQTQGRTRNASRVVSRIAGNTNLAQRGFELGLDQYIVKNPSQGNYVADKLMATTVEAIVGAVFLETNWDQEALQRAITALGLAWPDV
ncbi:ribonuclease III [Aspergillus japonicus CBS 114.51]|uniref:Ribonuclease III n=2 Tax=Aspergillus TaxID=5052 RepID=A0A2V5GYS0_ASPV1|nr:ribonuclease III [Aspergillus japonicus CBS 114.51]PYI16645.1 ribonuclease III [Aspergillus violaceofuscus CBS 115571]RAH80837.1 ribonuclease III [Aspergillus japonicus CBS 114.51]